MRKIQIDWQIVVKFSELVKDLPEDEPIFVGKDKVYNSTVNDILTRHCKAFVEFRKFQFTDFVTPTLRCFCLQGYPLQA